MQRIINHHTLSVWMLTGGLQDYLHWFWTCVLTFEDMKSPAAHLDKWGGMFDPLVYCFASCHSWPVSFDQHDGGLSYDIHLGVLKVA